MSTVLPMDHAQRRLLPDQPAWPNNGALPSFLSCLTAPGQLLAVDAATRKVVALLEVDERQATLFWTNRIADRDAYQLVQARARQAGFHIIKTYEASPDLISVFYGQSVATAATTEYRGTQDELLDSIVAAAVTADASDIHIRVQRDATRIYLRVHGDLVFHRMMQRVEGENLTRAAFGFTEPDSRRGHPTFDEKQEIAASMSRTVRARVDNETSFRTVELKMRWQSVPREPDGWTVVLRLLRLGAAGRAKTLADLGYLPSQIACLQQLIRKPVGLLVLSGATGSGKSTTLVTLATMYHELYGGRRLMRSIEDPCEYQIAGIEQHSVSRAMKESNSTDTPFARLLRACMRADPDALLIGEVRDEITANLSMQAVQTGHLVLTTVHAADPLRSIERLIQLGVERSEMAADSFLHASIYQRLLPTLCEHCKIGWAEGAGTLAPSTRAVLEDRLGDRLDRICFRGPGCDECRQMGIAGRTVVAQIVTPDLQQQWMILEKQPLHAFAYWRGRVSERFPDVQGFDVIDHAIEHIGNGRVSPIDADLDLGGLDNSKDPGAQKAWYAKHPPRGTASGVQTA